MKHLFLVLALFGNFALADVYDLKTKVVEITPPVGANPLEAKEIEKRFTNGNPPNVVFDIEGAGSSLTIKESVTLKRDAVPSDFGQVMIDALRKSTRDFLVTSHGDKTQNGKDLFEIRYTDTSENDLKMTGITRLYIHGRTLVIVGFRIPTGLRDLYEDRMMESINTFTFTE